MSEGPVRSDRKHPQNRRHPISKEIRRTWMSTERADNKKYNPFWAPQRAHVTFGNQALGPAAGVAYHNRAHYSGSRKKNVKSSVISSGPCVKDHPAHEDDH